MDFLIDLALWPLIGIFEAGTGLLWPSDDPGVRRLQRITQGIVIVGLLAFLSGGLLAYATGMLGYQVLILCAAAYACLVAAGMVGNEIEKRCKAEARKPN